jgi:ribosomal protein L11 methylase PrmA
VERFRRLAADGADLVGEARLLDALVAPGSHVLDAGCGTGRVAAELHRRGHRVVGVDVDPVLLDACRADHPGPLWIEADLSRFDLGAEGVAEPFDGIVVAGNVLAFVAAGTEPQVLSRLRAHLSDAGRLAIGFGLDRGYALADFDDHCRSADLTLEHRFATWDLRPFTDDSDFAVSLLVPA